MAEIRRHRPHTTAIGDQVRAAVGGVPRPRVPGSDEQGGERADPFFSETGTADQSPAASPGLLAAAGPLGGFTLRAADRAGLVGLDADQIREMATRVHEEPADGDGPDRD